MASCRRRVPPQKSSSPNVSKRKICCPSLTPASGLAVDPPPLQAAAETSAAAIAGRRMRTPMAAGWPGPDRVGGSRRGTPRNLSRAADSDRGEEASVNAGKVMEVVGPLDDAELVRRIRAGEPALFELVMRRYNQRLFRVLRAVLRDDAEAEDVLQEAYVRAFAHLGQLDRPERLASWLTHIAVHEAKARLRRRGRVVDLNEVTMRALRSDAVDPEQEALGKQLQAVLAAA